MDKVLFPTDLKRGCHLFVSTDRRKNFDVFSNIVRKNNLKGEEIVYVATDKSYEEIDEEILNSNPYIVVPKYSKSTKKEKIITIEDETSLVSISMTLHKLTTQKSISWLFFDSVERMIVTNEVYALKRFFSYLIKNLSQKEVTGVFLALDSEQASRLIPYIRELFDSTNILNN